MRKMNEIDFLMSDDGVNRELGYNVYKNSIIVDRMGNRDYKRVDFMPRDRVRGRMGSLVRDHMGSLAAAYAIQNDSSEHVNAYCDHGFAKVARMPNENDNECLAIVDSGASHHVSPTLGHFAVLFKKYCVLKVADRELPIKAQYGRFKKNQLVLTIGLYNKLLNGFLVSVYRERLAGNEVHFAEQNTIVNHDTRTIHEFEWIDLLPRIRIEFVDIPDPLVEEQKAFAAAETTVRDKFLAHVRACHFACDCIALARWHAAPVA